MPLTDPETTVVDNSAKTDARTAQLLVTVYKKSGGVAEGVKVRFIDSPGGTPDVREGKTGPNGKILFKEAVGGPPANHFTVEIPAFGIEEGIGRVMGGQVVRRQYDVGASEPESPASEPPGNDPPAGVGAAGLLLAGVGAYGLLKDR